MSRISKHSELVTERKRLEQKLQLQKTELQMELVELKVKLEPLTKIVSLLGRFNKKEDGSSSLLSNGMSLGIDLLGGRYLSHTNWIARTLVPFVVKGIAKLFFVKKPTDDVL